MGVIWLKKLILKFIPEPTWENLKSGFRHPVIWVKGEGIPKDHITPWELLLHALSSAFGGMSGGFTGRQDFLFKEYYRIKPNYLTVAGFASSIWDAVNDPLLGAWMDRRRYGIHALKTIMRISAFTGNILNVVKMVDGGLSAWQHVALLIFCNITQDLIGTLDGVAGQKIRSGISPLTQQRSRVKVWSNMGAQATWVIGNLPTLFMGFRDVFHWSDYQIIVIGALVFLPFGIMSSILPTFVRQRVDYTRQTADDKQDADSPPPEEKLSFVKSFEVIKQNRYFLFNSIANLITVFSPNVGDELLVYRYLVPKFKVLGREMTGEGVLLIKQMISGIPASIMQPFNRQLINKIGGPLRAQQLKSIIDAAAKLLQFFVGYKSIPQLAVMILAEAAINAASEWDKVAGDMLNYEFYDYVELKTGQRSEGITYAIDGLFKKIITNNIGLATGNAFLTWTGYSGGYAERGIKPPALYMKWMWPMYTLVPVIDNSIYIICRSFVKWKPEDRERTEAELAQRRALLLEAILDESKADE